MKLDKETYNKLVGNSIKVKENKYHNKKCIIDGICFDSKKEGYRYLYLKELENKGIISCLDRQVSYELQPSFKFEGKIIRSIRYVADFVYIKNDKWVVEDVKGVQTDIYKLKKKIMLYKFGIEIKEV